MRIRHISSYDFSIWILFHFMAILAQGISCAKANIKQVECVLFFFYSSVVQHSRRLRNCNNFHYMLLMPLLCRSIKNCVSPTVALAISSRKWRKKVFVFVVHQLVDTHVIHLKLLCSLKRFRTGALNWYTPAHLHQGTWYMLAIRNTNECKACYLRYAILHLSVDIDTDTHTHGAPLHDFPCIQWSRSTECMG